MLLRARARLLPAGSVLAMTAAVLGLMMSVATAARASTVVALWHMDETSGTVMHDSAGSNNGTLTNVGVGKAGFSGKAYRFNGSSSKVIVPSAAALNPGAGNFTVTVHVKFSVVPPPSVGDYDLIRKGFSGTSGGDWKMEILPVAGAGKASCYFRGSKGSKTLTDTSGPNLADGAWHAITCQRLATSIKLTVDGRTLTSSVTLGTISNTTSLNIGSRTTRATHRWTGIGA